MSLQSRLGSLVSAIGTDIKSLQSQITALPEPVPRYASVAAGASPYTTKGVRATNAFSFYSESIYTGPLALAMPPILMDATQSYFFKMVLTISDFYKKATTQVIVSGYTTTGNGVVNNSALNVSGPLFGPYRWGVSGGRLYFLMGDDTNNNSYINLSVDSFDVWWTGTTPTKAQLLDFYIAPNVTLSGYSSVVNADQLTQWRVPTLQNAWVSYSAGLYLNPRYRLTPGGQVEMQGLVKNGAAATAITTLPAGFRPDNTLIFITSMNSGFARVDVGANGVVNVSNFLGGGTNAYLSLAGITFTPAGTL